MGIFRKLFSRDDNRSQMTMQKAEKIIQRYGDFLQIQAPPPGCVADAGKLPFQKQEIKEALILGLRLTNDSHMQEMLKIGYINLANWQDGVGELDQRIDLTKIDSNDNLLELSEKILSRGSERNKWDSIVLTEQETLKRELQGLGLW